MEKKGRYGEFGGQYAAETLMNALINLEEAFNKYKDDEDFNRELNYYHKTVNFVLCRKNDKGSWRCEDLFET